MVNRWFGICSAALMVLANTALVLRDMVPEWLAGNPPESAALHLQPDQEFRQQNGIFNAAGTRIGTIWSVSSSSGTFVGVRSWALIEPLQLPPNITTPRMRITTQVTYCLDGRVESLLMTVEGFGMLIRLNGNLHPPDMFPCEWQLGDRDGKFMLDAAETRALGSVIRPFESLAGLDVGQSWRVKLINPFTRLLPGFRGPDVSTSSVLVRVTAREWIEHSTGRVEAFRVETNSVRAWVNDDGRVLRQEIELPVFEKLRLEDEPYDLEAARHGQRVELNEP
ncbi:MAG: hypothetical protein U1D55_00820 [Phycisphaerae bacterium]